MTPSVPKIAGENLSHAPMTQLTTSGHNPIKADQGKSAGELVEERRADEAAAAGDDDSLFRGHGSIAHAFSLIIRKRGDARFVQRACGLCTRGQPCASEQASPPAWICTAITLL